ncbi:MAG: dephospho-CoA kinase [Proteobacteria bacterium]|nr:dephospho-CoA kinase [Pseudomonadota bacterium]
MTLIVGLTGGLGSGKSTVADFFKSLGIGVIDADEIAKALVKKGEPALTQIVSRFGKAILTPEGELNRPLMREKIFNNAEDKLWLENLLHPIIFHSIKEQVSSLKGPYCVVVVPLLAERIAKYKDFLDHILVVDAKEAQQIAWTAMRDNIEPELIKKMIHAQASREERLKIADTVIVNAGSLEELKKKVEEVHRKFLAEPSSPSP